MSDITLITSVIKTVSQNLAFTTRSVYNHENRFRQTLETIESVRKYSPNSYIVLVEGSEIPEEWENELINKTDFYYNISYTKFKKFVDSPSKGAGESSQVYAYLTSYHFNENKHKFKTFSKLSGRYKLTDKFINRDSYFEANKDKNKILVSTNTKNNQMITVWYCLGIEETEDLKEVLEKSLIDLNFLNVKDATYGLECYLYRNWMYRKKFIEINSIGLEGGVSTSGVLYKH